MIFIHNYFPRYTKKLIELGIAKKGDGFKLSQLYLTPDEYRFNNLAKEDGELFDIVKNYASCFYVDRLQGGTFYMEYDFDKELLAKYKAMCPFLGFQLHELGMTRMLDWKRVERQLKACGFERNEENVLEAIKRVSASQEYPHFSQGRPSDYATRETPTTLSDAFADIRFVIERALKRTDGDLFNCDGGPTVAALDGPLGIKTSFIEVGCQTLYSRMQYALRRGASRAYDGKWGAYLEPWANTPNGTTCYCFMRDGSNEWFVGTDGVAYNHDGERGGSSMSYARRMMYYTLFAGAHYFAEEWGQANTFYDFDTFELSPYGKIKKAFADFAADFKNVKPYAPIALVIPREYSVINTHCRPFPYDKCTDDTNDGRWRELPRDIVKLMYNGQTIGEAHKVGDGSLGLEDCYFTVGRYGSIFDIIFDDSYENPEDHYEIVVDYTGKLLGKSDKIIDYKDNEKLLAILDEFVNESLPVKISSSAPTDYTFFENDGKKYVAIFNHSGVSKDLERGEFVNPEATLDFTVDARGASIVGTALGGRNITINDGIVSATLDGGEFILVEYK